MCKFPKKHSQSAFTAFIAAEKDLLAFCRHFQDCHCYSNSDVMCRVNRTGTVGWNNGLYAQFARPAEVGLACESGLVWGCNFWLLHLMVAGSAFTFKVNSHYAHTHPAHQCTFSLILKRKSGNEAKHGVVFQHVHKGSIISNFHVQVGASTNYSVVPLGGALLLHLH